MKYTPIYTEDVTPLRAVEPPTLIQSAPADCDDMTTIERALRSGGSDADIARHGLQVVAKCIRKHRNYGRSVWKVPLLSPRGEECEALWARLSDKVERLVQLRHGNPDEVGESIDNTMEDVAGYAILFLSRPAEWW